MPKLTAPALPSWDGGEYDPDNCRKVSPSLWNMGGTLIRWCPRCKRWQEQEIYFSYDKKARQWRSYCDVCRRAYAKDQKRDYKHEAYVLHERCLKAVGDVCEVCGEKRKSVLDFHHLDRELSKQHRGKRMTKWRYVLKHPDEFRVLCKNCHYLEHHPNNHLKD